LRLICFPCGGGGATPFREWQSALPGDIDLWAVRLPGRETRTAEEFVTDANRVVESIAQEVGYLGEGAIVFYGHSLGAALAVQTASLLRLKDKKLPALLILSGRLPPHHPYNGNWAYKPENELIEHLVRLGGLPPEVLANRAFLSAYLPKIRADFVLNDSVFYGRFPAFDFPITVINGTEDPLVGDDLLEGWREYTTGGFRAYKVRGNHFFFQSNFAEFIAIVSRELAEVQVEGRSK